MAPLPGGSPSQPGVTGVPTARPTLMERAPGRGYPRPHPAGFTPPGGHPRGAIRDGEEAIGKAAGRPSGVAALGLPGDAANPRRRAAPARPSGRHPPSAHRPLEHPARLSAAAKRHPEIAAPEESESGPREGGVGRRSLEERARHFSPSGDERGGRAGRDRLGGVCGPRDRSALPLGGDARSRLPGDQRRSTCHAARRRPLAEVLGAAGAPGDGPSEYPRHDRRRRVSLRHRLRIQGRATPAGDRKGRCPAAAAP